MRYASATRSLQALALGLVLAASPAARPEEPKAADAVLKDLGLSVEKTRYIFPDDEKALFDKYQDAKASRDQARVALEKAGQSEMIQEGILQLQAQEQEIRAEIGAMKAQAAGMSYGRRRGGNYYRNQANAAVRQQEAVLKQLQSQINQANKQKPTAKQQQLAEMEARQAMDRAEQTLKEVNSAFDALEARYDQVRAKPGVMKALEDQGRVKKVSLRLGPSEEAEKIGKWAKGLLKIRPKRSTTATAPAGGAAKKAEAKPSPGLGGLN